MFKFIAGYWVGKRRGRRAERRSINLYLDDDYTEGDEIRATYIMGAAIIFVMILILFT